MPIIEFVRLNTAAEEGPWSRAHTYRVLTEPAYAYMDPRPKLHRAGRNTIVLERQEWEAFKARILEQTHAPKKTKLGESRRKDREKALLGQGQQA